jgi:hypothetical protein
MPGFKNALDALLAERAKAQKTVDALNRAIAALSEPQEGSRRRRGRQPKQTTAPAAAAGAKPKRKRRPFSEATKAKMREAQRQRRAKEKGQETAGSTQ